ncbi:Calcitonin gene-related peptide 2 [Manis javanica]|nr:Calcitonin gene-related peptide 2 [Manis javanica]
MQVWGAMQSHCRCRLCSRAPATCCQRGVMGFWKFSPFLALSILVLYQMGFLQAAPLRATLEICSYPATLSEEESRVLLAGLMKDYVLMKIHELGQETEGSRITAQRRICNTATCPLASNRGTFRPEYEMTPEKSHREAHLYF